MLNVKEVIKAVNATINRNSKRHYSSVTVKNTDKPQYNTGINQLKICSLNHIKCKEFYRDSPNREVWERRCPFGLMVSKKSFNTSTNFGNISTFSIVGYKRPINLNDIIGNLPKKLKPLKNEILDELDKLEIVEAEAKNQKFFIDDLLETLLIGRIGLSIQSLSHEFFTPLQGAMSDVKNIEAKRDLDDSTKRLQKNFQSLNRLATEIQFVLSTSQQFNINMCRRVTVHFMVDEIFDTLSSKANEKNIQLKQGFNQVKTVDAIPTQINIVLSNIISNAVKYSYKGQPGNLLDLSVVYNIDDEYLVINIINEGCRITDEEIRNKSLFNLGYRGDHSGDRQRPGSGSGLFISNEIVKIHGGRIDYSSNYCGGSVDQETDRYKTVFKIFWPIIIE
jgi:signal transduction histidine kinase